MSMNEAVVPGPIVTAAAFFCARKSAEHSSRCHNQKGDRAQFHFFPPLRPQRNCREYVGLDDSACDGTFQPERISSCSKNLRRIAQCNDPIDERPCYRQLAVPCSVWQC